MSEYITYDSNIITKIDQNFNGELVIPKYNFNNVIVDTIDSGACQNGQLTGLNLSLTEILIIKRNAFQYCSRLQFLILPESITTIETNAFNYCSFSSIFIPCDLINFDAWSFGNVIELNEIQVDVQNEKFISISNFILTKDFTKIVMAPRNITSINFTLFNQVNTIGSLSLANLDLESFYGPSHLKTINTYAFTANKLLKIVDLRKTQIQNIVIGTFQSCTSLKYIYFPQTCSSISQNIIDSSIVKAISIPQSVTELKNNAFYSCLYLKRIIYYGTTDFSEASLFKSTQTNIEVHVPIEYPSNTFSGIPVIKDAFEYSLKEFQTCFNYTSHNNKISIFYLLIIIL